MADKSVQNDPANGFDVTRATSLVRAALAPNERTFFKEYLGQESPDIGDYLSPQGRFAKARELRDLINKTVVLEAYNQSKAPTVGDVQTLFPGHNELIPPGAYKPTPQAPLQSDEMPVLTGTQQAVVPDTRFQGPMPGVMTALGAFTQRQKDDAGGPGLSTLQQTGLNERQPYFYEEGSRPTRVQTTGIYSPDTAPSQSIELDKSMKLPPVFQAQVGALQHQLSTRQPQAHAMTEAEINLANQTRLERIIQTGQEAYPGERQLLESRLSIFNKENRPNSTPALTDEAKLRQERAKAELALEHERADVNLKQSQTKLNEAHTKDSDLMRQAKLDELIGRTALHRAQGNIAAAKAELAAFAEQLRLDERTWKIFSGIMLTGDLDNDSKRAVLKPLLERSGELTVNPQPPGMIDTLLGREHGSGITIQPKPGVTPYQWINPGGQRGMSMNELPEVPIQPQPEQPAVDRKKYHEEQLKKRGAQVKDGETFTYEGQTYRRNKGKVEKVQ